MFPVGPEDATVLCSDNMGLPLENICRACMSCAMLVTLPCSVKTKTAKRPMKPKALLLFLLLLVDHIDVVSAQPL